MSNTNKNGEYDGYDYRTSAEMTLQEQLDSTKKALASAIRLVESNKSDNMNKKIEEIKQKLQQLENIKAYLGGDDKAYDVLDPENMNREETLQYAYAAIRDNLFIRGLNRKEINLLLEEYNLKERLAKMSPEQLQGRLETIADDIFAIRDKLICNRCHQGSDD